MSRQGRPWMVFVALLFASPIFAAPPNSTLTILHTNDLHGHVEPWAGWGELADRTIGGLDRLATAIKQARTAAGPGRTLLLDAGDTFGDTLIADRTKGKVMVDAMNAMRYDAMVIGNHEPDFTAATLKERIREARFPVLAANIRVGNGQLFARPYVLRVVNGVHVGILGLAYPNTPATTASKNVEGLTFLDAVETARAFVPRLRDEGAQLVIVLSHYGLASDQKLARDVAGIDLIVGGHSHNRMTDAVREGDTLIVQAGAHGSDLGRIDLDIANGRIVGHRRRLITIDNATYAPDAKVAAVLRRHLRRDRAEIDRTIAEAASPITRAQTLAGQTPGKRGQQSPADSLFADLLREATGAEVALLPGVGYGVAIPPGPISNGLLRNLIPHESKTVTLTLTGAQLREIIEQSLENTHTGDPTKKVGGIIQPSGLTFEYDRDAPSGKRVLEAMVGSVPLDPARRYRVATNSLLAEGGHHYRTFKDASDKQAGPPQHELVSEALAKLRSVTVPSDLRIVPVKQQAQAEDDPRLACLYFPFFEHSPCFFIPSHTPYK